MTALAFLVGWIAALAAFVAVLALRRPAPATFEEHAASAVATAALDNDNPIFTEADTARFTAEWLAYVDSLPTTCERKYPR